MQLLQYVFFNYFIFCFYFFFQAEDGIRDLVRSRGLGDVYKRQTLDDSGMVTDFSIIKKEISDVLDHKHLNDILPFLSLIHI